MKAWVLEKQASVEQHPLKWVDVPTPHAREGEIRLKVLVCGVCRTDIHIAEGDLPLHQSPVIPGHEVLGVVDEVGKNVQHFRVGDWAGVYWLHRACGRCRHCLAHRENYCPKIQCTGWDVNGGYAEYVTAPAAYALPLNGVQMSPAQIAPLMCPGISGYAAIKLTGVQPGDQLGLYGFGPTAYYALKVARHLGVETYVSTRSRRHMQLARSAGARWAANAADKGMPTKLDAAILFPPAGDLVEPVLAQVKPGGVLVMAPVSASPIRIEDYSQHLWGRDLRTLYHLNRSDAEGFFGMVGRLKIELETRLFPFEQLPEALILIKHGRLEQSNAVIEVSKDAPGVRHPPSSRRAFPDVGAPHGAEPAEEPAVSGNTPPCPSSAFAPPEPLVGRRHKPARRARAAARRRHAAVEPLKLNADGSLVMLEKGCWFVCFVPGITRQWWHPFAHKRHKHVFALRSELYGLWTVFEPWWTRMVVASLRPEQASQFLRWGARGDVLLVRESIPGHSSQFRGWMNCAALTVHLLGRRYWAWTPHQLYRRLLQEPGTCRVDVSVLLNDQPANLDYARAQTVAACPACAPGAPRQPGVPKPFCLQCGRDIRPPSKRNR
ncbi:MAG: zinc-binding alcohol dehydrogenase family protein [Verrucomicrobia bacterium]|nr:zinc-binding alcohol dehydrogenase family protein [Verrucomicrobiota bacterium]